LVFCLAFDLTSHFLNIAAYVYLLGAAELCRIMGFTLNISQTIQHYTAHITTHTTLSVSNYFIVVCLVTWLGHLYLSVCGLIEGNPGPEIEWLAFLKTSGLKIISQNVGRLITTTTDKIDLVRNNLSDNLGPLIMVLSESWLSAKMDSNLFKIKNLKIVRFDRAPPNRSMGLVLYYSSGIPLSDFEIIHKPTYSLLTTCIVYENKNYCLCFVYRPPRANRTVEFLDSFERNMEQICADPLRNVILMGDVNMDLLKPDHPHTRRFSDIMAGLNLEQNIIGATRTAILGDRITSTLIDHVYTSNTSFPHDAVFLNSDNQVSDHNAVGLVLKSSKRPQTTGHVHTYEQKVDYTKFDEGSLRTLLGQETWVEVELEPDLNSKWDIFIRKLRLMLERVCQKRRVKTCVDCPGSSHNRQTTRQSWFDEELKADRRRLNDWLKAYKCTKIASHFLEYKRQLREYKDKSRRKCRDYFRRQIERATSASETQKIVSKLTGNGKERAERLEVIIKDGVARSDSKGMADIMNVYFTEVGAVAAASADRVLPLAVGFDRPVQEMHFVPPGFLDTYKHLNQINVNKPAGPDGIPGVIFKTFALELMFILEHIFAACIYRSAIPDFWKISHITPVFKKGLPSDPSNYRPIAITSVIPKIFEKILYLQLIKHLETEHLLTQSQYGYRVGMSTTHAVLDVSEKIRSLASQTQCFVGLLLLDLSKAFDCVNHHLLTEMLAVFGLDEFSIALVKSFLTGRQQLVKVNGCLSQARMSHCGVPQGSLLGPILFDIYVNALSRTVESHVVQYADDAAIICSHRNYQGLKDQLTRDFILVLNYFKSLGLSLNVGKTEYLVFGEIAGIQDLDLSINGTEVKPVESAKYLGVTIDNALSFDQHNRYVMNKIKRGNFLIRSIRSKITLRIAKHLLHALVYSHHDYACIVWEQKPNSRYTDLIEKQHRFCLKSVFRKDWRFSSERLYRLSQLPPLSQRRTMNLCRFVHSSLSGSGPDRFNDFFVISNTARGEASRRLLLPRVARPINFVRRAVKFRAVQAWNTLPTNLRVIPRESAFKTAIARLLRPQPL
jgi:hypothetical protein